MSTPLITNFSINTPAPIDNRIVATSATSRDSIQYKYDGMKVFLTDTRQTWTYNSSSATWSYDAIGNGIYGGSGSLITNTYIDMGSVNNTVGASSYILGYSSTIGSNVVFLNTNLLVKTADGLYDGISFRTQYQVGTTKLSYIEYNPDYTDVGAFAIGTNNLERIRVSSTGKVGIGIVPYGFAYLMVSGPVSTNGVYINYNNSNSANTGGGYSMIVDSSGNFSINDTSPNSFDYKANLQNSASVGYKVLNIKDGKFLIGGTVSGVVSSAESRLEIYETALLGTTTGDNLLLTSLTHNPGAGSNNIIRVRNWAFRDKTYSTANDWQTWRIHNGISIDTSFGVPGSTTRCFWERDILSQKQWFGSSATKTIEIDSYNNSFSIAGNIGLGGSYVPNFQFLNKEQTFYISSDSYVIYGTEQVSQSNLVSYSGGNGFIKNLTVPSNCSIVIEVIYNSSEYHSPLISVGSPTIYSTQNKITSSYRVSSSGVISLLTSVTDMSSNESGYLQYGTIDVATSNTIKFRQNWTAYGVSGYVTNIKLNVHYRVFISSF